MMEQKPPTHYIRPDGIVSQEAFGEPELWGAYSFAPDWFADALAEACAGGDHRSRRREIVFAVCAAESYLFEWVRDDVLHCNFSELLKYFPPPPPGQRGRGIREKWKEVPKALVRDGKIPAHPDYGGREWQEFDKLVDYRNGLVHARASRPETEGLPENEMPVPTLRELSELPAGWATHTVATLIRQLHSKVGTKPPAWLQEP